jgi:hypothetical protein
MRMLTTHGKSAGSCPNHSWRRAAPLQAELLCDACLFHKWVTIRVGELHLQTVLLAACATAAVRC